MASVNRGKCIKALPVEKYKAILQAQIKRHIVESDEGCWLWTGRKQMNGYATTRMYGKNTPAHRAAYFAFIGNIKDGLEVCHTCDVRRCVNPRHLFIASHSENMRDMSIKGRGRNGFMSGAYVPLRGEDGKFIRRIEK